MRQRDTYSPSVCSLVAIGMLSLHCSSSLSFLNLSQMKNSGSPMHA
jgi:hypothetical protein